MKKLLVLILSVLVFGCDDPAVSTAIGSLLTNGAVKAQAVCEESFNSSAVGNRNYIVEATLLQDGSCYVTLNGNGGVDAAHLGHRQDAAPCSATWFYNNTLTQFVKVEILAGDLTLLDHVPSTPVTSSVSSVCTGSNLGEF